MRYFIKMSLMLVFWGAIGSSECVAESRDVVVVANVDNKDIRLDKRAVRNLFMGNAIDVLLEPVSLPPETLTRAVFNTKVIGLTESRIQSYWSQMRFSGRSKPPREMQDIDDLLAYISTHKDTVAFFPADTPIPDHLTVVYQTRQ
ncbi:hypothetical protein FJ444_13995 [Aestuariibacter sp. GS-14]|uniref:hypothetical protein n=1 Tax=Aestuariibacter sp. GS-14 TaxID=2590670 RepID=UPI00112B51DC|nr:hypothetical protein [Aestuariibacter sp. GS-14]TPV56865.1 hypothetical protein FJ444_13995 [Aestuariibacter sp. GS-14]